MTYVKFARVEKRGYIEPLERLEIFFKIILHGAVLLLYIYTISTIALYIYPFKPLSLLVFFAVGRNLFYSCSTISPLAVRYLESFLIVSISLFRIILNKS